MNPLRVLLVLLAVPLLVLALPGGALAHQADPRIATELDQITPPLPSEVVVQAQAGIAAQLVASNPTETELEVLGEADRAFLRISSRGVFADLETEEFFTTSNPNGGVPPGSGGGGPPRWVQISAGSSWGWYDHRLHPQELRAPEDPTREARLGEFEIPLLYGGQRSVVQGHVQFQPLLGAFQVTADPAPQGLVLQALPGKLPGLFLSNPQRMPLEVAGRDGEPFLRFTEAGVEVNRNSRTHVEDRQARGMPAGPPSPDADFALVAPGGSSYTWLDARLRYPDDRPPPDVLRAAEPEVVQDWSLPAQLAGEPVVLTGKVTWVPAAEAVARAAELEDTGSPLLPIGLGVGAVAVLAVVVVLLRRRRV